MAESTRELVLKVARSVFPDKDQAEIIGLLDLYGVESCERERVQLAILKLSEGELTKLRYYLKLAREDYRDVLAYAEYPLEMRSDTWKMDAREAHRIEEIRSTDRKQYDEWLRGHVG